MTTTIPKTLEWVGGTDGRLRLIDQTRLPGDVVFRDCAAPEDVWTAIRELAVRGAPAIGVAAAYGVVLGLGRAGQTRRAARETADYLKTSRPTAVNLFWALDRMVGVADSAEENHGFAARLLSEAHAIRDEDAAMCRAIGAHGATLLPEGGGVLTHCNAGGLATSEYGTALAVIRAAAEQGKSFSVFVDETRPLLQGSRLTAWELAHLGIDHVLICDNMAATLMRQGKVRAIVVGADRIAANGDTANKIGTYGLAVLARAHGIPFYVAAPSSTFDLALATGDGIPVEERDPAEITHGFGRATAPAGTRVYNPAFDVTPAGFIDAIVTECGIIRPVTAEAIQETVGSQK
jgi:methylthioribose-1-phosphate isomerase